MRKGREADGALWPAPPAVISGALTVLPCRAALCTVLSAELDAAADAALRPKPVPPHVPRAGQPRARPTPARAAVSAPTKAAFAFGAATGDASCRHRLCHRSRAVL